MNELDFKRHLIVALTARGFVCQPHEDRYVNFIPDLSLSGFGFDGWLEVKYREKEPKTLNAIDHWTKGQEQWLCDRGEAGSGHCYLVVGTPSGCFVWNWSQLLAARHLPWPEAVTNYGLTFRELRSFGLYLSRLGLPGPRTTI